MIALSSQNAVNKTSSHACHAGNPRKLIIPQPRSAKPGQPNANALKVIQALAGHKRGMTSWQIKKQTKLHERTVERALNRLKEDGTYLQASGKTSKNGTIYLLTEEGRQAIKVVER